MLVTYSWPECFRQVAIKKQLLKPIMKLSCQCDPYTSSFTAATSLVFYHATTAAAAAANLAERAECEAVGGHHETDTLPVVLYNEIQKV